MTQTKYISIIKMSIIHAIALFLLMQLTESFWMIKFIDCIEIVQQKLNTSGTFSTNDIPECYDEETQSNYFTWNSHYTIYAFVGLFILNIVLSILSILRIGHKWYWFILSFLTYLILVRLLPLIGDMTNFTYKILFNILDSVALAIYSNIIIVFSLSLFLYFGKPIINFIRNEDKSISDRRLDDILDA